MTKIIEIL